MSSSRHPDQWIVPGGGMEPEEEPCGAAVREVYEEVGPYQVLKVDIFPFFQHFHWIKFRPSTLLFLNLFFDREP